MTLAEIVGVTCIRVLHLERCLLVGGECAVEKVFLLGASGVDIMLLGEVVRS